MAGRMTGPLIKIVYQSAVMSQRQDLRFYDFIERQAAKKNAKSSEHESKAHECQSCPDSGEHRSLSGQVHSPELTGAHWCVVTAGRLDRIVGFGVMCVPIVAPWTFIARLAF